MSQALIVIDLQNDYFPGGKFPLWKPDEILKNVEIAIGEAQKKQIPVVVVQHVARGASTFFSEGSEGVKIHPRILAAAPKAPIVIKQFADSFYQTTLDSTLSKLGATELLLCGMMTQNCVTHTALSKSAEKYKVAIIPECCTTVSEMIHAIALSALSIRAPLKPIGESF